LIRASVFAELMPHIEARARSGADLVGLHIGDSYKSPPAPARFAHIEGAAGGDPGLYQYGDVNGLAVLRDTFAAHLRGCAFGQPPWNPAREVLVACGATHALFCAARAVFDVGDEVLVLSPYWPLAPGVLRAAGAVSVELPLSTRLSEDPSLDVAAVVDAAVTKRTRGVYFATPNNPDGKVFSPTQLAALARVALSRDLWVIADEVYADYVYAGAHTSIAGLEGMADRTLTVYSLSKSHALAGVRVGFAVGPERAIAVARRVGTHTIFHVPLAAQRLALAALGASRRWLEETKRDYIAARDAVLEQLSGSGVKVFAPEGGSYVFVDLGPALRGRSLTDLLQSAIDRGVLVAPGEAFGQGFESWVRLCFTAAPIARVSEGTKRLLDAIADFG
jgi:aspartate/methionine/tyrosine aminotransferase